MRIRNLAYILFAFIFQSLLTHAQNPVIQTNYTADPAPMVYNDTVFLYTSHDEDDAQGFKMLDWLLYTSTDMVNWTEHGVVASLKDFKWVNYDNGAWAVQCIERNGKSYLYCPMPENVGIGVLVADSPYGPFNDPLGKPLINNSNYDMDPTILIDDDGQAYMYWGNLKVLYKLDKETKNSEYLAQVFDRNWFLDPLSHNETILSGLHSNTHIVLVNGFALAFSISGEGKYHSAVVNFWEMFMADLLTLTVQVAVPR